MKSKEVSIVLPCYNVDKYIDRCIKSILNQKYLDFELIIINDGSTDSTTEKLRVWNSVDERINLIETRNGGQGRARNIGIENSKGKYITFIDSDDFVSDEYLMNLIWSIESAGANIAMSNRVIVKDDNLETKSRSTETKKLSILDSTGATEKLLYQNPDNEVWGKIFLKELFSDICFPVNTYYEDMVITFELIAKAQKIAYINSYDYFYVRRENSSTNSSFNVKKMDILIQGERLTNLIIDRYPQLEKPLASKLVSAYTNVWMQIPNEERYSESSKLLWNEIRKNCKVTKYLLPENKKVWIAALVSVLGPNLYRRAYQIGVGR